VFKIDEDASFGRCVLLDGRELEGDWWIVRPLGVLGNSGVLLVQDRITGNLAPLSSVMLLVAGEPPLLSKPVKTEPHREDAFRPPVPWLPERMQPDLVRPPAPALVGSTVARSAPRPGGDWSDILMEDTALGLDHPLVSE
jgi:hypothetical protein